MFCGTKSQQFQTVFLLVSFLALVEVMARLPMASPRCMWAWFYYCLTNITALEIILLAVPKMKGCFAVFILKHCRLRGKNTA